MPGRSDSFDRSCVDSPLTSIILSTCHVTRHYAIRNRLLSNERQPTTSRLFIMLFTPCETPGLYCSRFRNIISCFSFATAMGSESRHLCCSRFGSRRNRRGDADAARRVLQRCSGTQDAPFRVRRCPPPSFCALLGQTISRHWIAAISQFNLVPDGSNCSSLMTGVAFHVRILSSHPSPSYLWATDTCVIEVLDTLPLDDDA